MVAVENRRTLASAGLTEATVDAPFGPQTYWSGGHGEMLVLLHGAGDSAATWAPVAAALVHIIEAYQRRGVVFKQGYGLTEVGVNCFSMTVEESARKKGAIGKPMMFTEARAARPDGCEAGVGEVGELWLRGPHVCKGYWNDPHATSAAALVPIAFGAGLTPAGFRTAAMFCLLFGAGGQLVAGLGNLLNGNLYGGTLFTSFAFNWVINWWVLDGLSRGQAADPVIVFAVDICFLIVFVAFTYGFGFFSSTLMAFLIDIDVLYAARIAGHLGAGDWLAFVVALCTVALGALSLWIAFALLINPVAGRPLFAFGGPVLKRRTGQVSGVGS